MYKILENWEGCFSSKHEIYIFRNGMELRFEGAEYDIILNDDFISKYPINYLVLKITKKVPKNIEHTYDDLTS